MFSVTLMTFWGFWLGVGRISSGIFPYPSKSSHCNLFANAEKIKGRNLVKLTQLAYKYIKIFKENSLTLSISLNKENLIKFPLNETNNS